MITITIEEEVYELPNNWLDVTLDQFLKLNEIDEDFSEIEKNIHIISILSNIPVETLMNAEATQYGEMLKLIQFINSELPNELITEWEYDDIKYQLDTKVSKYTVSQYLDLDYYTKELNNLPYAIAVLFREVNDDGTIKKYDGEIDQRAEIMKNMPISMAISAQVFFSTLRGLF